MSDQNQQLPKRSVVSRFAGDVTHMARWQKVLLGLALATGVAGGTGQAYSYFAHRNDPPAVRTDAPTGGGTEAPGRTFVGGSPQGTTTPDPATQQPAERSLIRDYSPGLTKTGLSFIASFIIGWLFRIFLKTMALIAILIGGLLFALSWFKVINIDFSAAEQTYASASAWLWDQASRLKDLGMAHLGASTSGAAGLFVGLRKK